MTIIKNDTKVAVLALHEAGIKPMAISNQLGIKYNTVKKFIYNFKKSLNLPPKLRVYKGYFQGRIPLQIKTYVTENPTTTTDQILEALELDVSADALNKWMNANNLGRKAAKRSILISDINKEERVAFARLMLTKSDDYLKSIVFSDETMVKAFPNGEITYYRASTERTDIISRRVQQGGSGQMLWGCVSFHAYGPLVALEGIQNSQTYLDLLQTTVRPELVEGTRLGLNLVFQQDNAKCHKTPAVMQYLEHWGYEVLDWPPQSPDLSPIEMFWNILKMKMKALRPRPRTKATMRGAMLELWAGLDDELRVKVMSKFRGRCLEVVASNGDIILK
jgi:transposase